MSLCVITVSHLNDDELYMLNIANVRYNIDQVC